MTTVAGVDVTLGNSIGGAFRCGAGQRHVVIKVADASPDDVDAAAAGAFDTLASGMPHGGFTQSGYGNDMSMYAIEAYTEPKHVMVKW